MNKVYCWFPKKTASGGLNVGHASLDIAFGQGAGLADYVSWWPAGGAALVKSLKGLVNTYPEDVMEESGEPDRTLFIDCLDERRMRERWLTIQQRGNFTLFFKNCTHSVAEVLLYGGAILSPECRQFAGKRVFWMPYELISFSNVINKNADFIRNARSENMKYKSPFHTTRSWMPLPYRIQYD